MAPVILKVDGSQQDYPPANGKTFTLDELKKAIGGGWIEIIRLPGGRLMVIDEEGKLKNMELNRQATLLLPFFMKDCIVGDALLCEASMIE